MPRAARETEPDSPNAKRNKMRLPILDADKSYTPSRANTAANLHGPAAAAAATAATAAWPPPPCC